MATWNIVAVEVEAASGKITRAHWRLADSDRYGDATVPDLEPSTAEADIIAAVKESLGADRVKEIEASIIDFKARQLFPSSVTATLADLPAKLPEIVAGADDRARFDTTDDAGKAAIVEAREAVEAAKDVLEEKQAAKASAKEIAAAQAEVVKLTAQKEQVKSEAAVVAVEEVSAGSAQPTLEKQP